MGRSLVGELATLEFVVQDEDVAVPDLSLGGGPGIGQGRTGVLSTVGIDQLEFRRGIAGSEYQQDGGTQADPHARRDGRHAH
ncbi:hypothetical protein BH20ACT23_BH20ACT23_12460 [soil metagenome]